jgi:cytochrome c oxidase subunit 3
MIVAIAFLWLLALGAALYLVRHRLASKPWLERGSASDLPSLDLRREPAARAGLVMLLAVVGVLFALVVSAFLMRAGDADWFAAPPPRLLWFNTALLFVSSFGLEGAARFSARKDPRNAERLLLLGALAACGFIVGQIVAWREFAAAGFGASSNAGNAFFYLMTGLHGVHMLGGLAALAITFAQTQGDILGATARLRLRMCASYWHFLLIVWLFLFALLQGVDGGLVALCRGFVGR